MADYPPFTQPSDVYNITYWNSLNYAQTTSGSATGFLTEQQANSLYLQLLTGGIVQGSSIFPSLTVTDSLTAPSISSNTDLSITTADGNALNINGGKTGGDININVSTTDSNINVQSGDINLENGTLNVTNGNIQVSGLLQVSASGIQFPTGTQSIPYTGGAGNITYTNYNHNPDGTTQTYTLPADTLMDVVFFGRGGTTGTAIEGTLGSPTEGQVAYGGSGGGASCAILNDIYLQYSQNFTITYNADNSILVNILGKSFTLNGGGNGTNATGNLTSLTGGTAGTGGINSSGIFGYNGVNGTDGIVGEYATPYTTQRGFPPSPTNGAGGSGGYQINTGSAINSYLPGNAGVCIISYT